MLSKEEVLAKLKTVEDPEIKINIVDLGLIYKVGINKKNVDVLMTLTTPGCPLSFVIDQMVRSAVKEIKEVDKVTVRVTFDPPWNVNLMSEEAKLTLGIID